MRSIFYMPPLQKISGGLRVIAQIASQLSQSGYETILAVSDKIPADLPLDPDIGILPLGNIKFHESDRFIVPESWPNALAHGLSARAHCRVFVQSWSYLHGNLPPGARWFNLPVKMLAISYPVARFIKETTGLEAPVIPPFINTEIFYPASWSTKQDRKKIRIAWMPRKNRGLAGQIKDILESMLAMGGLPFPHWIEINNMSPPEVGATLRGCQIFLATGFPEGFGLPPLEAMACGCVVAGFTGMGGWDYMRQALPAGCAPVFPLPIVTWGPNGFYAADGDTFGAALALRSTLEIVSQSGSEYMALCENARETAAWYSLERQKTELINIWQDETFWDAL